MSTFEVESVRARFPALTRHDTDHPAAYLDGPGGTQVPAEVVAAISAPLLEGISNLGGDFAPSRDAEEITGAARAAGARLFNTDPREITFGQNMTSLTFAMSRALSRTWTDSDAVVVTSLDHDANYTPWVIAAEEHGAEVRIAEFDSETGILPSETVIDLLDERVRVVAVGLASNALGSVVDVAPISNAAHEAGALVYVDAVHAAPHRLIDITEMECDFLVASAYKFFGPHTGLLWGRPEHMATIEAYKVRPAPSDPPEKWETGTQSFESLAGVSAAVEYLTSLGEGSGRAALESAFGRIAAHETILGARFLDGVSAMDHVRLYGVPEMNGDRVATFALSVHGLGADQVAERMARAGIYVWSGHYYALNAMHRLGVLDTGGLVRIGFVHYNTVAEVDRALEVLAALG